MVGKPKLNVLKPGDKHIDRQFSHFTNENLLRLRDTVKSRLLVLQLDHIFSTKKDGYSTVLYEKAFQSGNYHLSEATIRSVEKELLM